MKRIFLHNNFLDSENEREKKWKNYFLYRVREKVWSQGLVIAIYGNSIECRKYRP